MDGVLYSGGEGRSKPVRLMEGTEEGGLSRRTSEHSGLSLLDVFHPVCLLALHSDTLASPP